MKHGLRAALLTVLLLLPAAARAAVSVTISPRYAQLVLGATQQFDVTVTGTSNHDVVWLVNGTKGGSFAAGKVTTDGLYTAPPKLPKPAIATVTAISKADPSVRATATVTLLKQASTGQTYYVATAGNDNAAGTINAPWKTIQHAADAAAAGDTVQVRQGIYNEHVTFHISGSTAKGPITFQSYPGETATLDGTGLTIPQHQWGLLTFNSVSYVIAQGFEVRNFTTASTKDAPIGIFVTGSGLGVQIVNNYVHDITTTAAATPSNCASNAFGIEVYGTKSPAATDGIAISGNEIAHLKTGCSETLSLDGNVTNWAIVENIIHDNDNIAIGAIGFEKVCLDPAYDQARAGVIRGNTVYNITSYGNPDYGKQYAADGIYVDGGTNIIIEQNLIHNVDLGIEVASEHKGHTSSFITARNNVIYNGNSAGISIGGYDNKRGGTDHVVMVGNTLYNNDTKKTGSGEFQIQFNATNNTFQNNIVYAGAQNLLVHDFTTSTPDPATLDNNLYFSSGPAAKAKFVFHHATYTGYAAYRSATGQDSHSPAFTDPQFVSIAGLNFDIAAGSPARGAGAVLGANVVGASDIAGNKRVAGGKVTIGAYQQ
ncbi:MAG TPA: right-handed parallel beta-helix repeat-containing protein [Rhizomicrobium sp.]|jgi:hypothetical protein|nr:right-handed parallel beta-helix repeat-containing protein [Rhizomicrobium sp.]